MTVITRKCYDPGGMVHSLSDGQCSPLPRDISHVVVEMGKRRMITWKEVFAARTAKQNRRLEGLRWPGPELRALRVEVRYFNISFFGGWHTYLYAAGDRCLGGRGLAHWVRGHSLVRAGENPFGLLTLFPLIDPNAPLWGPVEDYNKWMPLFARRYQVSRRHKQPCGAVNCWAWMDRGDIDEILIQHPGLSLPSLP